VPREEASKPHLQWVRGRGRYDSGRQQASEGDGGATNMAAPVWRPSGDKAKARQSAEQQAATKGNGVARDQPWSVVVPTYRPCWIEGSSTLTIVKSNRHRPVGRKKRNF
jgi:hypothetical protein